MQKIKEPILMTGAGGFVGANLLKRLIKKKLRVNILINKKTNLWRIQDDLNKVNSHFVDITNKNQLLTLVKKIRPKTIFHLAAYGAYPFQNLTEKIQKVNLNTTINLLHACEKYGFDKFINTGSSSEYGFKEKKMSESDMLKPNSHYAVFKAAASLYCQYESISKNMPITTLRLFHVYGPFEEPSRLIPTLIKQLSNNIPPKLVSPYISRDLIYIDDVVDYFLLCCKTDKVDGEIINIGSGQNTNIKKIYSLVNYYLKCNKKPQWNSMQNRKWDQNVWVSNNNKANNIFNKRNNIKLEEGIFKFIKWYNKNKNIYDKIKKRK